MLDGLESYLGRMLGRDKWPKAKGRVESQVAVPNGSARDPRTARFAILSYEVNGQSYLVSIREMFGQSARPTHTHGSVVIQYNPKNPGKCYFAPACRLAGSAVAVLVAGMMAATMLLVLPRLR